MYMAQMYVHCMRAVCSYSLCGPEQCSATRVENTSRDLLRMLYVCLHSRGLLLQKRIILTGNFLAKQTNATSSGKKVPFEMSFA